MAKVTYIDQQIIDEQVAIPIDPFQEAGSIEMRIIKKIFIGNPVDGGIITIFQQNNAFTNDINNIVFKYTYTHGSPREITFTTGSQRTTGSAYDGLILTSGGSIATSVPMQISILWDITET